MQNISELEAALLGNPSSSDVDATITFTAVKQPQREYDQQHAAAEEDAAADGNNGDTAAAILKERPCSVALTSASGNVRRFKLPASEAPNALRLLALCGFRVFRTSAGDDSIVCQHFKRALDKTPAARKRAEAIAGAKVKVLGTQTKLSRPSPSSPTAAATSSSAPRARTPSASPNQRAATHRGASPTAGHGASPATPATPASPPASPASPKQQQQEEERRAYLDNTAWLDSLPIDKDVRRILLAERVTEEVLPSLTETDLKELGIPLGQRKVLVAIAQQRAPSTASGGAGGGGATIGSISRSPSSHFSASAATAGNAVQRAEHLFAKKRFAEAVAECEAGLFAERKHPNAARRAAMRLTMGASYAKLGDFSRALECVQRAECLQPTNYRVFVVKGVVLADAGRQVEAEAALRKANMMHPSHEIAHILARVEREGRARELVGNGSSSSSGGAKIPDESDGDRDDAASGAKADDDMKTYFAAAFSPSRLGVSAGGGAANGDFNSPSFDAPPQLLRHLEVVLPDFTRFPLSHNLCRAAVFRRNGVVTTYLQASLMLARAQASSRRQRAVGYFGIARCCRCDTAGDVPEKIRDRPQVWLARAIKADPTSWCAWCGVCENLRRGETYPHEGINFTAAEAATRGVQLDPTNSGSWVMLARALHDDENGDGIAMVESVAYDEIDCITKAITLDYGNHLAWRALAAVLPIDREVVLRGEILDLVTINMKLVTKFAAELTLKDVAEIWRTTALAMHLSDGDLTCVFYVDTDVSMLECAQKYLTATEKVLEATWQQQQQQQQSQPHGAAGRSGAPKSFASSQPVSLGHYYNSNSSNGSGGGSGGSGASSTAVGAPCPSGSREALASFMLKFVDADGGRTALRFQGRDYDATKLRELLEKLAKLRDGGAAPVPRGNVVLDEAVIDEWLSAAQTVPVAAAAEEALGDAAKSTGGAFLPRLSRAPSFSAGSPQTPRR